MSAGAGDMGVGLAGPAVGEGDVGRNDGAGSPFHPRPRGCSWQPFHCKTHPKPVGQVALSPKPSRVTLVTRAGR